MERDLFDEIHEQWRRQKPDADTSGLVVVGRILLLAKHLHHSASQQLGKLDLDLPAFEVLTTLWRQGPPYHLSPTELCKAALLSSGAMTNRIDRLETSGWVARRPDPNDRRGLIIELTPQGKALVDQAVSARLDEANDTIASLSEAEREELTRLLRKLLSSREEIPFTERNET
jgi:DNA-binding MarR family transcriptional regulator